VVGGEGGQGLQRADREARSGFIDRLESDVAVSN